MSLKAVHLGLMSVCIVGAIGFGVWCWMEFADDGGKTYLAASIGSFLGAVGLGFYTVWFLKKLKNIGYL